MLSATVGMNFQHAVTMGPYASERDCLLGASGYIETMEVYSPPAGAPRWHFRGFCASTDDVSKLRGQRHFSGTELRRMGQ